MTEPDKERVRFLNRSVTTIVPGGNDMAIRELDWRRIYRNVKRLPKRTSLFQSLAFAWLGAAASALCAVIPLYGPCGDTDTSVKPLLWTIAIACLVIGATTLGFSLLRKRATIVSVEEILRDMDAVNQLYFPAHSVDRESGSHADAGRHRPTHRNSQID